MWDSLKGVDGADASITFTSNLSSYLALQQTWLIIGELFVTTSTTVEPHYNEVLGTMKITLLYQVTHYIRVKKTKKYKELGPAKLPCFKRVLLYPTSL